jgi:hypothetical protein
MVEKYIQILSITMLIKFLIRSVWRSTMIASNILIFRGWKVTHGSRDVRVKFDL